MTEYELMDALNGLASNAIAIQALFITTLSAYMVMAYAAGRHLTVFQATFISILFVIFSVTTSISWMTMALEVRAGYATLNEVRGFSPVFVDQAAENPIIITMVAARALMILGALVFMWQVRHPKPE